MEEDYYIVNSSFEYFPGVPVYHSKNLVNWELIGHCLTKDEQLPLEKCRPSGGIYAPTLRYHDGWFFMITTNVTVGGNFIVHSQNPAEGWSNPAWVDQMGIDRRCCLMMTERFILLPQEQMKTGKPAFSCVRWILLRRKENRKPDFKLWMRRTVSGRPASV